MNRIFLFFALALLGLLWPCSHAMANGFDLEVSIAVPNASPGIWATVPVTITATNTGDAPGQNIQIRVGVCGGNAFSFVQESKLVYTTTGSSTAGSWDFLNQRWTIANLAPGQTATLTMTLFTLTSEERIIQVFTQSAGTSDFDSTPSNLPIIGDIWACTDNEDDEAVLTLNGVLSEELPDFSISSFFAVQQVSGSSGPVIMDNDTLYAGATINFPQLIGALYFPYELPTFDVSMGVYLSADSVWDNADVLMASGTRTMSPFVQSGGFTEGGIGLGDIPPSTSPGHYYLIAKYDNTDIVQESDETNNFYLVPVIISNDNLPDIDLAGMAAIELFEGLGEPITASDDHVVAGHTIFVYDHYALISVPGPVQTINYAVQVRLSQDQIFDDGDILLSSNNATYTSQYPNYQNLLAEGSMGGGIVPINTPPGQYYIIGKYDALNQLAESNENNNQRIVPVKIVAPTNGNNIDLALTLAQTNPTPAIYSVYTTTATISNSSTTTATGVKVKFAKPNGVVYQGGNEFIASQGNFAPYGNQEWNVGTLLPNSSATLTVRYFLLQNGAPVAYAQVSAANETDVDSSPNNGTPPTPNEDDEAVSAIATGQQPDLTISNATLTNANIQSGQTLNYQFDLANIGNAAANGNFNVKAWISTQPNFNTNGTQDGVVPTGNFAAGFSVSGVVGASALPNNLPDGQYYLHLWVDADQQVVESNEGNNTVSTPFLVNSINDTEDCEQFVNIGSVTCLTKTPAGLLEIAYEKNNEEYRKATLNAMGLVANDEPTEPAAGIVRFRINNGNLEKLVDSTLIYSLPIPAELTNHYDQFLNFAEFNGGYILFAAINADAQGPGNLYAIRTDENMVEQQASVISFWGQPFVAVTSAIQISDTEIAYTWRSGQMPNISISVNVMNSQLQVLSSDVLETGIYVAAEIINNACGQFDLNSLYQVFSPKGVNAGETNRTGYFENGHFVTAHAMVSSENSTMGSGAVSKVWTLSLSDGSVIKGYYTEELVNNVNIPNAIVRLQKKQGETLIWEKFVKLSAPNNVVSMAMTADELVFISERADSIFVETFSCVFDPNPKADFSFYGYSNLYPAPAQAGGSFDASFSIRNWDIGAADMFKVRAFISADTLFDPASDQLLGSLQITNVAPASTTNFTISDGSIPANLATGNYYVFLVVDADNTVAESNENNNIIRLNLDVTGVVSDCNTIMVVAGNSELTVAGANAPHVLIKVFRPDWTLLFECLDNCSNPMMLSIYNPGLYHVQVLLMDDNWADICYLETDINIYAGSKIVPFNSANAALAFANIFPNPTSYDVNLDMYSFEKQAATLEIYNAQGALVHQAEVALQAGDNRSHIDVFNWPTGFYSLILRTDNQLAYGRFIKVN